MKAVFIVIISLMLSNCDFLRDLKYQYYYQYQGKILCSKIETVKEENGFATKMVLENDPSSYLVSRLDEQEITLTKETKEILTAKKIEESDVDIWIRHKDGSTEATWIFTKKNALLTEIIIQRSGNDVSVVYHKFLCK